MMLVQSMPALSHAFESRASSLASSPGTSPIALSESEISSSSFFEDDCSTPESTPTWSRCDSKCNARVEYLLYAVSCINSGDVTRIRDLRKFYAPEFVYREFVGRDISGRDDCFDFIEDLITSIHDYRETVSAIVPNDREGNSISLFVTLSGTQVKPFFKSYPLHVPLTINIRSTVRFAPEDGAFGFATVTQISDYLSDINSLQDLATCVVQQMCPLPMLTVGTLSAPESPNCLSEVIADFWSLLGSADGAMLVQRTFDVANIQEQEALARMFQGHVLEAAVSPHASLVLQKCIDVVRVASLHFVLEELRGSVAQVALDRHGYRVLECVFKNFSVDVIGCFAAELLPSVIDLSKHRFGNFAVQGVLQHGARSEQQHILAALVGQAGRLAKHKVGNHVVLCALRACSVDDRALLVEALRSDWDAIVRNNYGSFVAREIRSIMNCR